MAFGELLDLVFGQLPDELDRDLLLLTRAYVLGPHLERAIRVDHESNCDLNLAAGGRPQPFEDDLTEELVTRDVTILALANTNDDRVLPVARRSEHLGLSRGDRGVAANDVLAVAVDRFDAERERRHVEEQGVLGALLGPRTAPVTVSTSSSSAALSSAGAELARSRGAGGDGVPTAGASDRPLNASSPSSIISPDGSSASSSSSSSA